MYFSTSAFQGEHLEKIQTLVYNREEDVVEVSDQNVGDLDPSGQNLDVSGDTLHNDTIGVEVDELESNGQNLDLSSTEHLES